MTDIQTDIQTEIHKDGRTNISVYRVASLLKKEITLFYKKYTNTNIVGETKLYKMLCMSRIYNLNRKYSTN